jgi:hypothetical protein
MKNDVDEMSDADDTPQMDAEGTMITSLCWVSRGFAKPLLEEANPDKDEKFLKKQMLKQSKLSKKAKVDIGTGDIAQVAKQLAENMEDMDIDE